MEERHLRSLGADFLSLRSSNLQTEGPGIFQPTATTSYLLAAAKKYVAPSQKVLDLGCGWGIIGLELALQTNINLHLSDMSQTAVAAANFNSKRLDISSVTKTGSIFEPWKNFKFDLIVGDVSGISTQIPFANKWFDGVPFDSGLDGTELTKQVISNAAEYLNPGGILLIPVISLSNIHVLQELMSENYNVVEKISENIWKISLPEDEHNVMDKLKAQGAVSFTQVNDIFEFSTYVYMLKSPKEK